MVVPTIYDTRILYSDRYLSNMSNTSAGKPQSHHLQIFVKIHAKQYCTMPYESLSALEYQLYVLKHRSVMNYLCSKRKVFRIVIQPILYQYVYGCQITV